jgi:hypothetical protein
MVGMLVRDQNGGNRGGVDADLREPFEGFLPGQPRVDKDASPVGGHQSAIARAGRS